ncbi:MAG: hypothetical protein EOP67_08290, partial [Sphingomonas sp.]
MPMGPRRRLAVKRPNTRKTSGSRDMASRPRPNIAPVTARLGLLRCKSRSADGPHVAPSGALSRASLSPGEYPATGSGVVSHTASLKSDAQNLALSERRGRGVEETLVDRAADPGRLDLEPIGESQPIGAMRRTQAASPTEG